MDIPDLLKVSVIKREKIFVLFFQTLDIMSYTLGEVPDIPGIQLLGGESTVLINSSQEKRSVVDKAPFSL